MTLVAQHVTRRHGTRLTFQCARGHLTIHDYGRDGFPVPAETVAQIAPLWGLGRRPDGTRGQIYGPCSQCHGES